MPARLKQLSQKGFTGIEVLIVLTIAIIVAILVANNIQESIARGRDIERQIDINAIQTKLEEYWHSNEHYPAELIGLSINGAFLTDPSGNFILVRPESSNNKPDSGYSVSMPEQEYIYAPYECGPIEATETAEETGEETTVADEETTATETPPADLLQICQKYVLYSWLEKAEISDIPYQKNNLHNTAEQ